MKRQEEDSETNVTEFPYKHNLEIREEKQAIMSKIKYVTSRSIYDILDRIQFDYFLDYLSKNSRNKPCQKQIKDLIWNSSPKQARDGVLIKNILNFVAQKLVDDKESQFRQEMFDIFMKLQSRHREIKPLTKQSYLKQIIKKLLSAFPLIGIGYKLGKMNMQKPIQEIKTTGKSIKQVGSQCNTQLQTSLNPNTTIYKPNVSTISADTYVTALNGTRNIQAQESNIKNIINQSALAATTVVQNTIIKTKKNYKVPVLPASPSIQNNLVSHNVSSGLSFIRIQSVFKTVFEFIGKRVSPIEDIFRRLFFEKNQLEKTWKFSPMLSLCNILQILQIAGIFYCISLMFRKQKKMNKKEYQIDSFFN